MLRSTDESKNMITIKKEGGATNEHELLKDADISDDQGMLKYGIDLTDEVSEKKINYLREEF